MRSTRCVLRKPQRKSAYEGRLKETGRMGA
jgi:hypothetical protein